MAAHGKIKPNKQKKRFGNRKAYVGGGKVRDMIVRLQLNSDWLVLSLPLSFFPPVDLGASCRHPGDVFSPSAAVHYCFIEEISAERGGEVFSGRGLRSTYWSLGPNARRWS